MDTLVEVCKSSKDFVSLLNNPIVNPHKKNDIFDILFGKSMDKMSMGFIKLITKNSRENLLPYIADSFISQFKTYKNIIEVHLTSAVPLEKSVKEKVMEKVKESFTGTIELHEQIDPSLIGGFVVRIGDKQLDSSIANQLKNLNHILLN